MSDAFLADNVDTTLANLLYNVCGDQWIARSVSQPRKTCVADALLLCASWAFCHYRITLYCRGWSVTPTNTRRSTRNNGRHCIADVSSPSLPLSLGFVFMLILIPENIYSGVAWSPAVLRVCMVAAVVHPLLLWHENSLLIWTARRHFILTYRFYSINEAD